MAASHVVVSALACALAGAAIVQADEGVENSLHRLGIKYSRDSEGTIVAVELPQRSSDRHFRTIVRIPTITEMRAPQCEADPEAVQSLETLPLLDSLYLEHLRDADTYVDHLLKLKQLRAISLAHSTLSDAGLNELCKAHPHLRELDVSSTRVTSYGLLLVSALRDLETLRMLKISEYYGPLLDPENGSIANIADLPRLRRLAVTGVRPTSDDLSLLASNCHLEALTFEIFAPSPGLRYLHECNPSLGLGPHFFKGVHCRFPAKDSLVTHIQDCDYATFLDIPHELLVDLEELDLHRVEDLDFVRYLPKLKRLTLSGFRLTSDKFAQLNAAKRLNQLTVYYQRIDGDSAKTLLALESVTDISLGKCVLDEVATRAFREYRGTKRIHVDGQ
jgi:hypothetical protein